MIRRSVIFAGAVALCILATQLPAQALKTQSAGKPGNALITALWFSHLYAEPQVLTPSKDRELKATLADALRAKKTGPPWNLVSGVFENVFFRLSPAPMTVSLCRRWNA